MHPVKTKTALGAFLKEKRMALGLTLKQLASRVSVSPANLNHYETGQIKGFMPIYLVGQVSKALRCKKKEILSRVPPKPIRRQKLRVISPAHFRLGKLIRFLRFKLGISQRALEQRMGRKGGYIARLEIHRKYLNKTTSEILTTALECDPFLIQPFVKSEELIRRMKPSKSKLGKFIRERRLELGLSEQQVATQVGVSRAYISALEIGLVPGDQGTKRLPNLACALQIKTQILNDLREEERPRRKINKVVRQGPKAKTLGTFLTNQRIKRGFSQAEFSEKAGLSHTTVNYLERDRQSRQRGIQVKTLEKLQSALGCKIPEELL